MCVQGSVSYVWKPIKVSRFCFVSNRHCISLCLGFDPFPMSQSLIPYGYTGSSYRRQGGGLLECICMKIVPPKTGGICTRRGQKPSLFIVVTGGSRGVLCSRVCASFGIFCLEIHHCHDFVLVSNRHCNFLWLGFNPSATSRV